MIYVFEYSLNGSVVEKFEMDFYDKFLANSHAEFLRRKMSIFDERILKVRRKTDRKMNRDRHFSKDEAHFIIEYMLKHRVKHLKTSEILRRICSEMEKMK